MRFVLTRRLCEAIRYILINIALNIESNSTMDVQIFCEIVTQWYILNDR